MRKAKRTILIAMLICTGSVPLYAARPARSKGKLKHPSVTELMDKYAQNQNKVRSFTSRAETSSIGVYSWENFRKRKVWSSSEVRFDGSDRGAIRKRVWGNVGVGGAFIQKGQAYYKCRLWDGKDFYQYDRARGAGRLYLTREANSSGRDKRGKAAGMNTMLGAFADRVCAGVYSRDKDRIDIILGQADTVSVQDKMDTVGGSKCYVINADTKFGKYTIWIDPQHGYNVAKAIVSKQAGDWMTGHGIAKNKQALSFILENVRFEKIDDVWVSMEADTETKDTLASGKFSAGKGHFKRTEFIPNPDHDALGSFLPDDIQNGAKVRIVDVDGRYTWQDGQVVGENGGVIMNFRQKWEILYALYQSLTPNFFHVLRISLLE